MPCLRTDDFWNSKYNPIVKSLLSISNPMNSSKGIYFSTPFRIPTISIFQMVIRICSITYRSASENLDLAKCRFEAKSKEFHHFFGPIHCEIWQFGFLPFPFKNEHNNFLQKLQIDLCVSFLVGVFKILQTVENMDITGENGLESVWLGFEGKVEGLENLRVGKNSVLEIVKNTYRKISHFW